MYFGVILILGMCFRNFIKILVILVFFAALFCSCDAIDTILPSAGNYKLNVQVNNTPLDECSFITSSDRILLSFEDPVSNDKDVTALMVFLRNQNGEVIGRRVLYSLDRDISQDETDELVINVNSLDDRLPVFPMPSGLPAGRYIMVSQVMSGRNILQRNEKHIYYLSNAIFSYDGINVYLPGVTKSSQLIPRGTVVMLEADIDFISHFDPYIIWYEGRNKISEGKYSDGAGLLFWKTPEQSGFYTIRAEVFPVKNDDRLAGYRRDVSLLVSSMAIDVHMISQNVSQLVHWYTLEGNLLDSKMFTSAERSLRPAARNNLVWMGANRTYGIATGSGNIVNLPKVLIPNNNNVKTYQILFRFMPINDGGILSAQFGISNDVNMNLSMEGKNLILTLTSPLRTVSQVVNLPDSLVDPDNKPLFITAGINFSVRPGSLSAQINILDNTINSNTANVISLNVSVDGEFQISLGYPQENNSETDNKPNNTLNMLWDEIALYYMPPMEIIAAELKALSDSPPLVTSAN
ncbi:MAG: hypothetical protein FWD47_04960 [Treponema sp.]|nr:hypothetical protein [Treponema sp.]